MYIDCHTAGGQSNKTPTYWVTLHTSTGIGSHLGSTKHQFEGRLVRAKAAGDDGPTIFEEKRTWKNWGRDDGTNPTCDHWSLRISWRLKIRQRKRKKKKRKKRKKIKRCSQYRCARTNKMSTWPKNILTETLFCDELLQCEVSHYQISPPPKHPSYLQRHEGVRRVKSAEFPRVTEQGGGLGVLHTVHLLRAVIAPLGQ